MVAPAPGLPPVDRVIAALEALGCRPRQDANGWTARCPVPEHGDRKASLAASAGADRRVLLHCFGGCTLESIAAAMGLEARDLFLPRNGNGHRPAPAAARKAATKPPAPLPTEDAIRRWTEILLTSPDDHRAAGWTAAAIDAFADRATRLSARGWTRKIIEQLEIGYDPQAEALTFPIRDAAGVLVNVIHHCGGDAEPKSWGVRGRNEARLYPAQVKPDGDLYIVEGLGDAVTMIANKAAAITATGGAGSFDKIAADLRTAARGRDVITSCDNDSAGSKGNDMILGIVGPVARSVRVVRWPAGSPPGYDVGDFLEDPELGLADLEGLAVAVPVAPAPAAGPGPALAPDAETDVVAGDDASPHLTDAGNADRFARDHDGRLLFIHPGPRAHLWTGTHWAADDSEEVVCLARETVAGIYAAAARSKDEAERKALGAHALKSEAESRLRAMISLVESDPRVKAVAADFDRDPWLLNVANGTLDLRTARLKPHDPQDRFTYCLPTPYDPTAKARLWTDFLARIFARDAELVAFVQRLTGYTLTGSVREQILALLIGQGCNGKSTLIETLRRLFGPLARQAQFATFLRNPHGRDGSAASPDIARLRGARLVTAIEADTGSRISESTIKSMTGGDAVLGRGLYMGHVEFQPTFKIWLAANTKPRARTEDAAYWRRIRLVPFPVVIPDAERDNDLVEKLCAELPGILAWAVRGCLDWQRQGLGSAPAVAAATDAYRVEMDPLTDFLEERCTIGPGYSIYAAELHRAFKAWSTDSGGPELSKKAIASLLQARDQGITPGKGSKGARLWNGIALREETRI